MGTPSVTIVRNQVIENDGGHVENVMRFYRHWDGYPSGHGYAIAKALVEASGHLNANNRNWAQHFMAELLKDDPDCPMDIEFMNPDANTNYGQCYTYVVTGRYEECGGKYRVTPEWYRENVTIKVYMGTDCGHLIFAGDVNEFMNWKELRY